MTMFSAVHPLTDTAEVLTFHFDDANECNKFKFIITTINIGTNGHTQSV